jgi:hypothetical protein
MKALRIVGIVVGALIVLFLAAEAVSSGDMTVSQSIVIDRPAAQIQPLVADFVRYNEWQPWKVQDPKAVYTLSSPSGGVGAKMSWVGEVVGTASNTIVSVSPTEVQYQLVFLKPFQSTFSDFITLQPEGSSTKVTWRNEQAPMGFGMHLMAGMIKGNLDKEYATGLANLKKLAESQPVAPTDTSTSAAHN